MANVILAENEYITVQYVPEKGMIHHTIHQPYGGAPFREALNKGTTALKEYGICKWLSDDRKNGPLSEEDIEWGFNDWNKRTIEAGWKYWALVVPTDVMSAGSLMPTIQALFDLGLRAMVFDNLEAAQEWLDSM